MKIATSHSVHPDETTAITEVYTELLQQLGGQPSWLLLSTSVNYDNDTLLSTLSALAPDCPIHGGTSCQGSMTQLGFHSQDKKAIGLFGLRDEGGNYGVGSVVLDDNPKDSVKKALLEALEQSDREGELPAMVWVTPTPGLEEEIIQGIEDFFGTDIPIIGGSSADDDLSGKWEQFSNRQAHKNGLVVSVLFPSTDISFAFHSGYEPTRSKGTITRTEGRTIYEIDDRPAIEVYKEWIGEERANLLPTTGNVLANTTFQPLGREVGEVGTMPYFQLSHPEKIQEDGSLTTFTACKVGEELHLMTGNSESLIQRAGRVAQTAVQTHPSPNDIAGALVIYCAGCMLATQERMDEVATNITHALRGKPFLGSFTYGEQGCFTGGENRHGNLMISVVVFGS